MHHTHFYILKLHFSTSPKNQTKHTTHKNTPFEIDTYISKIDTYRNNTRNETIGPHITLTASPQLHNSLMTRKNRDNNNMNNNNKEASQHS